MLRTATPRTLPVARGRACAPVLTPLFAAVLAALVPVAPRPAAAQPVRRPPPVPDTLWLLAATPAHDAVHRGDTEAALIARYGRAHVVRDSLPGAEGEMFWGTVLFPRDPRRRAYVYWTDEAPFKRPASVRAAPGASAWVAWPGVATGQPMADVERLNGRAFRLFGFEWDYGGAVVDWRGGRLAAAWRMPPAPGDSVPGRRVAVGFRATGPTRGVRGEGTYGSSLPAMRRAAPRVADLTAEVR